MTYVAHRSIFAWVNAWAYCSHSRLVRRFRKKTGMWPNVAWPRTYVEKMLWRKVFDHNPLFVVMSDKLEAKSYVESIAGSVQMARVLWSGERPEDMPSKLLDAGVMMKANHGSGFNRRVDSNCSRSELNAEARRWLERRYGIKHDEWAYSQVRRRLFVEEILWEDDRPVDTELKFNVFGGRVYLCNMIFDRTRGARSCAFLRDGTRVGSVGKFGRADDAELPPQYPQAVELAERLSKGTDYIRCDLYPLNGRVYFSELTVYPLAGYSIYRSDEVMKNMSALWDLRQSWFLRNTQPGMRGVYARALRKALENEYGAQTTVS